MSPEQIVYTKSDLRRLLQCSSRTIERWVNAGRLPSPILPGRWSKAEVERHIATLCDIEQNDRKKLLNKPFHQT